MRAGGGPGRWRGWVDTSEPGRPPRRRPPWWPEGEPFPPAWRRGRRGPPQFIRWIGCLFLFALVLAAIGGGLVGVFIGRLGFLPIVVVAVLLILLVSTTVTGGMRRMTRPMDNLIDAARRIEGGDFSTQVPESGPPELRSVARAFNSMSARLKTIDEQRRGFLADVTHELRTPLSVIRGQAEAIADGVYAGDAAHIAPILDATQTLDRLVEDLRTLALTDAGNLALKKEPTDLGALAHDVAESFQPEAATAGVTLTTAIDADLPTVDVDPARLRQVTSNLLSNAINHTPNGGSVKVSVSSAVGQVTLTVADTGEGIPPDLLPHVFERFAKGPSSKGSGLGLAIAHAMVTAHGGQIQVSNGVEAGTVLRVILATAPNR
jgi:two-component system, OmpR family, sensor histidine kinase BaeS